MKIIFISLILMGIIATSVPAILDYFTVITTISGDTSEQAKNLIGIYDIVTTDHIRILNADKVYWNGGELINLPINFTTDISIDTTLYTIKEISQMYSVTEEFLNKRNPNAVYKVSP